MSDDKTEEVLLRGCFDRFQSEFDQFSKYIYEAVFRSEPRLRRLFRNDLAGQGKKFLTTLREICLHVNEAEREYERQADVESFMRTLA